MHEERKLIQLSLSEYCVELYFYFDELFDLVHSIW